MDTETLTSVLDDAYRFWFGELASPSDFPEDKQPIWFKRTDETDRAITDKFDPYLQQVAETGWDLDGLTRQQSVGLVVMLDQFPRNIFRESGEAFAFDAFARDFSRRLIAGGLKRFFPAERSFLGMPFMHGEDIADQDYCVFLMAGLVLDAPEDQLERYRSFLDYATKHRDIIRRFGRFPHRNLVLGRQSTEEELAFVSEHGRGF